MTPFVNDSIMESLRVNYHVEASGVEQEVSCVLAKAQEAQFLKVSVGSRSYMYGADTPPTAWDIISTAFLLQYTAVFVGSLIV
jgi:hypothetical protein